MTFADKLHIFCSIPKTLRFNLHYFPFKTALRCPVIVSRRVYLRELHGKVSLPEKADTGSIRIGFGDVGHYDRKRSRTIWQVSGEVNFKGKASIGHGSKISVRGKLALGDGFNITAESTVDTALFLNTVPREESMRRVVASSPSAPDRHTGDDSAVWPSR